MDDDSKLIGIELRTLKQLMNEVVAEQLNRFAQNIKEGLAPKTAHGDRLYTNDVAKFLGVSRQTVHAYRKKDLLPAPQFSVSGRAYWTREEIEAARKTSSMSCKFERQ